MRPLAIYGLMLVLTACSALFANQLQSINADIESHQVVVKFLPQYRHLVPHQEVSAFGLPEVDRTLAKIGSTLIRPRFQTNPKLYKPDLPDLSLICLIEYEKDISPYSAADMLMLHKYFKYAEPLPKDELLAAPNDAYYSVSSYLTAMNAEAAWDIYKGENDTTGVLIAVVDSGLNWRHPDIRDNIFINVAELPGITIDWTNGIITGGDGIDNDNNGKIDDVLGWDFMVNSSGDQGNNPFESAGHGTTVCGLANARTNNTIGVCSIPWNLKLMPISCSFPGGSGIYRGYEAIVYAAEMGAAVINYSAGSTAYSQSNQEAVNYAWGLGSVIVAAAGNSNNQTYLYPAAYNNVVAVASVLNSGVKSSSSSYGRHIDVCAPSEGMYSLSSGSGYNTTPLSAFTSYAAPIATGLAALIKSANPSLTNAQVVNRLIGSCADIDALNPTLANLLGDGMLNAYAALADSSAAPDMELRIDLRELMPPSDANGNLALERNEEFSLNLNIVNFATAAGSDNVTYTLSCSDPAIIILNNTHYGALPPDGCDILSNAFLCRVSATAVTKTVVCTLTVNADLPITSGSVITFTLHINAGSVFVWEGLVGSGYSGRRIRDTLIAQGHSVFYTRIFPFSFHTFSAVYLSFGMATISSSTVTRFDRLQMFNAVKAYLEQGGRLYIEGNDAVGFDLVFLLPDVGGGQSAAEVLWPLLGIAAAEHGTNNPIDLLSGNYNGCTRNISFTASTQTKLDYIEKFVPDPNTTLSAFTESNYGCVAAQHYGAYNQKTFVFSYCLAELTDGTVPSTRDSLLYRIMQDFTSTQNNLLFTPQVTISPVDQSTVNLSWQITPNTAYYNIYASDDAYAVFPDDWDLLMGMVLSNDVNLPVWQGNWQQFYRVTSTRN